jgi:hypothetical protein
MNCKYCDRDLLIGSPTLEKDDGTLVHFACELRNVLKLEAEGKCAISMPPEVVEMLIAEMEKGEK